MMSIVSGRLEQQTQFSLAESVQVCKALMLLQKLSLAAILKNDPKPIGLQLGSLSCRSLEKGTGRT